MIQRLMTKYAFEIIATLVCVVVVMMLFKSQPGGIPDKIITETDRLYKQNDELLKQVIKSHQDVIEKQEAQINILNNERDALIQKLLTIDQRTQQIKATGNEKVNRVNSYTDADILRYLSEYDSTRK